MSASSSYSNLPLPDHKESEHKEHEHKESEHKEHEHKDDQNHMGIVAVPIFNIAVHDPVIQPVSIIM
jgi:hypothetical protein